MSYITYSALSHEQRVKRLYKASLRLLQAWCDDRLEWRYHCVIMRERFEKNRNVKDLVEAQKLVIAGEKELFEKSHPQPYVFIDGPRGIANQRHGVPVESIVDTWHPLEKAQFPEYFEKRQKRKEEYVDWWNKKYGSVPEEFKDFPIK
ncbi:hypothetical protein SNEBB_003883 [Seison nebaliae]|nr:hypothetical protein SNEBB_003883 [Seison nebaliae]